jgi:hypothetical protein
MGDEHLKAIHWLVAVAFAIVWFAFLFSPAIISHLGK